ncbi:MAG TPA: helix-turn-helix transcriptional regulator [Oscillospiraceae bacterium]|nr:helix-turn-helix transcriptional regulator [Oscillospiraceae bacterium]HNW04330.1 helix-turn-helix transcriptional regulator [Oscillospiraceae bacterium]HPV99690.1 helix-turn-helix transcriptional regulator [Oscillospiraceae bacterium]
MDELRTVIASNIIRLRTAAGMTQAELGEKLNYSDKSVSKWERAESTPDIYVMKQMSDLFGVTIDSMTGEKDTVTPRNSQPFLPYRRSVITTLAVAAIWTAALLLFILFWILGALHWIIFVYAVPISLTAALVLNSVWYGGKHNMYIVLFLVLSLIATVYLSFLRYNWWQILLLSIPAAVIVWLSFRVKKTEK